MKYGLFFLSISIAACAHSTGRDQPHPQAGVASPDPEKLGRALAEDGRYMEACAYFDWAIARGSDERSLLPLLIAAQVYSDQLRAAEHNALRLRELYGPNPALDSLIELLAQLTPDIDSGTDEENPR